MMKRTRKEMMMVVVNLEQEASAAHKKGGKLKVRTCLKLMVMR